MKKLTYYVGVGLSAVLVSAAVVMQSCATNQAYQRTAQRPPGSPPPPPPPQSSTPIGAHQNSLGLGEDAAIGFQTSRTRIGIAQGGYIERPDANAPLHLVQEWARQDREAQLALAQQLRVGVPDEELWVIQKPSWPEQQQVDESMPRSGALMCTLPETEPIPDWVVPVVPGERNVPVPLKHTDVHAWINGYISSVTVRQQFQNPYSSKIEALYVFPLPENAGVNEFVMVVGERRIRGVIREREEAQRIYDEAKHAGHIASLLTQERPNIFTQHVANIEPGKQIDIEITYFSTLDYHDGAYEFVFPMVVGPRFNPPYTRDGIGAVPRAHAGGGVPRSGQPVDVAYLHPSERSGHDIMVAVDIDAGVPIERIDSKSHVIEVSRDSLDNGRARVRLAASDTVPNKDFVLRYTVAGERVRSTLLTQADGQGGGYFTLMLIPPKELASLPRHPMEMVFVIDRSGSMDGKPIEQARAALESGLRLLEPRDTFQIIDFAESASQFGPRPLTATPEHIRRGLQYAASLDAGGGTMMINGLRGALDFPHDPSRLRFVCFITDGYIGNEAEILGELGQRLGSSRVFALGVGSSVNRYLLAEMSRMGRGAVAYLGLDESAGDVMDGFFQRVSRPALADVQIDWGGARVSDLVPGRIPDLFIGRPVVVTGRIEGGFEGTIRVMGVAGGEERVLAIAPEPQTENRRDALACVWARKRIGELSGAMLLNPAPSIPAEVKRLALAHGLMSAFTSFVAVDALSRTEGQIGTTVNTPVPMPEGVSYETTVTERR